MSSHMKDHFFESPAFSLNFPTIFHLLWNFKFQLLKEIVLIGTTQVETQSAQSRIVPPSTNLFRVVSNVPNGIDLDPREKKPFLKQLRHLLLLTFEALCKCQKSRDTKVYDLLSFEGSRGASAVTTKDLYNAQCNLPQNQSIQLITDQSNYD